MWNRNKEYEKEHEKHKNDDEETEEEKDEESKESYGYKQDRGEYAKLKGDKSIKNKLGKNVRNTRTVWRENKETQNDSKGT